MFDFSNIEMQRFDFSAVPDTWTRTWPATRALWQSPKAQTRRFTWLRIRMYLMESLCISEKLLSGSEVKFAILLDLSVFGCNKIFIKVDCQKHTNNQKESFWYTKGHMGIFTFWVANTLFHEENVYSSNWLNLQSCFLWFF